MYCIARRCVLPSLSQEQALGLLSEAALYSLVELFEAVPDPRGVHGLRYDLSFLLTCLVAALLCNCDGSEAVAQWCRDQQALLQQVFGPRLFLTPSGSLYRWLLPQLDASAIERVLGRLALLKSEPLDVISPPVPSKLWPCWAFRKEDSNNSQALS